MSYFSTALNRWSERCRLSQADIARAAGLSRSHISRLCGGEEYNLADNHFAAVVRAFGRDPRAQAELVAARCMDVRVGPGSEHVEIKVTLPVAPPSSGAGGPRASVFPEVELSHETERAFAWLRGQCPLNPDLEKHLVGYARLTGMK